MKIEKEHDAYVVFEWTSTCGTRLRVHGKASPGSGAMSSVSCPVCGELTDIPTPPLEVFVKRNDEWLRVQS